MASLVLKVLFKPFGDIIYMFASPFPLLGKKHRGNL